MINHALIMAAGRGNRMQPLTNVLPKPMLPYKGDTLIGHSLRRLGNQVKHVHITVGYKKAMLSQYLIEKGIDSLLNTEGHGNAWWIQNTLLRYVNEPVLVLTTDNITKIDIELISDEYESIGSPADMIVPTTPIAGIDGDFVFCDGSTVVRIDRAERSDKYCTGIQVINPYRVAQIVNDAKLDDFYKIWRTLIEHHELHSADIYPYHWFSVDTLDQLAEISTREL